MTREEQVKRKEKKTIERNKRVLTTLKVFIDNDGRITDERLAQTLSLMGIETSSSTVGRDLTENLEKVFLEENIRKRENGEFLPIDELTEEQASVLAFVKKKRKDNKKEGLSKGGTTSSKRNDIEKTEDGKFNGCKKR